MNREEIIIQHILDMKQRLQNVHYLPEYEIIELEENIKALEMRLQFLQLPKRTIETLEVGDLIITTRLKEPHKEDKWFMSSDTSIHIFKTNIKHILFNTIQIIPHEALDMLKRLGDTNDKV